jgi:hypothetical protein
MNTRFKFALIRHLNSDRQQGFALPMAMMVGMVMLVVGITMIVRSQGDQSKVVAQQAKSASVAAAETGLTRIQSMMNDSSVRFIALYPMASWSTAMSLANNNTTVTINDTGLNSTVNRTATSLACSTNDAATKIDQIKAKLASLLVVANGSLTDIDPNDPSKGKFRLVNYTYTGTSGSMPGSTSQTGGLVLQGQTSNTGFGSASRLAVEVPISGDASMINTSDTAPGLWIKKGGVNDGTTFETAPTTLSNNGARFAANVLFSNCDSTLSDAYVQSVQTNRVQTVDATKTAQKTNFPFPSLPANPATNAINLNSITASLTLPRAGDTVGAKGNYHYILDNSANTTTITCTGKGRNKVCSQPSGVTVTVTKPTGADVFVYNNIGTISSNVSLPRGTDVASSDGVYRYLVNSVDVNGNTNITISNAEEVQFYLQGSMNFAGTGELVHNCDGVTDCNPKDFQIFAYDSSGAGQICLKGNTRTDGFILAPDYKLGKTGNGAWYGSLFANSWGKIQNCGSNNGATAVIQTANWANIPSDFRPASFSPTIGNFMSYKQQPVE